MESASSATTLTAYLLILSFFSASLMMITTTTAGEDSDIVDLVKGPDCSKDSAKDSMFKIATMPTLLAKLLAETPKHPNNGTGGGGFSYISSGTGFGPSGEGNGTCYKGKTKKECEICLGVAVPRLTADCEGKASGSVELKACWVSFKEL